MQELSKFNISESNIFVNHIIRNDGIDYRKMGEELYRARMAMQTKYLDRVVELYAEGFLITAMHEVMPLG